MAGGSDRYEDTLNRIETRLRSLESGAPAAAGDGSWTQSDLDATLSELQSDHETLRRHWRSATQVVRDGEPTTCAACGEPQDCSTAKAIFAKYPA